METAIRNMKNGDIIMLENSRFYSEEILIKDDGSDELPLNCALSISFALLDWEFFVTRELVRLYEVLLIILLTNAL